MGACCCCSLLLLAYGHGAVACEQCKRAQTRGYFMGCQLRFPWLLQTLRGVVLLSLQTKLQSSGTKCLNEQLLVTGLWKGGV